MILINVSEWNAVVPAVVPAVDVGDTDDSDMFPCSVDALRRLLAGSDQAVMDAVGIFIGRELVRDLRVNERNMIAYYGSCLTQTGGLDHNSVVRARRIAMRHADVLLPWFSPQ